jgi:hypothetical protein
VRCVAMMGWMPAEHHEIQTEPRGGRRAAHVVSGQAAFYVAEKAPRPWMYGAAFCL